MRAGRWWVLGLAAAAGAGAFYATDRDEVRYDARELGVPADVVRFELERIERQGAEAGYSMVRRGSFEGPTRVVESVPVVEDHCVIFAAGAWGSLRLGALEPIGAGRVVHDGFRGGCGDDETVPTRTIVVCDREGTELDDGAYLGVRASVYTRSPERYGEGRTLVMIGEGIPPPVTNGAPVLVRERVVRREPRYRDAALNAGATAFFVLLVGLMVEASVRRRDEAQTGEATLRRFTVAVRATHRGPLSELAAEVRGGEVGALRAFRAALLEALDDARAATSSRWREAAPRVEAREKDLARALEARRGAARGAGYRAIEDGWVAVTLLIRHRCELPALPRVMDRAALAIALEGSIPADPGELLAARVFFHPQDRAETLDEERLAVAFPELVSLEADVVERGGACAACEGVVRWPRAEGPPATCTVCGEPFRERGA